MSLGDRLFRVFTQMQAPRATMAYAVEVGPPEPESLVVCTKPTCGHRDGRTWHAMPLTQQDLDDLATAQGKPVTCDRCSAELTDTPQAKE